MVRTRRVTVTVALACVTALGAARMQPGAGASDTEELLGHLRENVREHDLALRRASALYEAGRASDADLMRARIARADAEALVGEVTGDKDPQRAAQLLRIELCDRILADMRIKAAETSTEDRLRVLREQAQARVRLWRLGQEP